MNKHNTKACYIIAGGEIDKSGFCKNLHDRYTICADSGFDNAIKLGLNPDVVLGDFDSISDEGIFQVNNMEIKKIKFPSEKDMTDTELAINYAIDLGFNEITIIGALGSRFDHSLSNIFNLFKYRNYNIKLVNTNNEIILINTNLELDKDDFFYSIIPLTSEGIKVNLSGFYYDSKELLIEMGSSIGISNQIKNKKAKIELLGGIGILIKAKDRRVNGK